MMKPFASLAALLLLGASLAACSDDQTSQGVEATDEQLVEPAQAGSTNSAQPANTEAAPAGQSDTTSNQVGSPRPQAGAGFETEAITGSTDQPAEAPAQ